MEQKMIGELNTQVNISDNNIISWHVTYMCINVIKFNDKKNGMFCPLER